MQQNVRKDGRSEYNPNPKQPRASQQQVTTQQKGGKIEREENVFKKDKGISEPYKSLIRSIVCSKYVVGHNQPLFKNVCRQNMQNEKISELKLISIN